MGGDEELDRLPAVARTLKDTPEDREERIRSIAYGNAAIENPRVTRSQINEVADQYRK